MNTHLRSIVGLFLLSTALLACSPQIQPDRQGLPVYDQPASVTLPHSIYFLNSDQTGVTQVFRIAQDGQTLTQLTFETVDVKDYDVSRIDGSVVFLSDNNIFMVAADGSGRHVLVDGGPAEDKNTIQSPALSPDGRLLAYGLNGLNLYEISTGNSSLVLENQYDLIPDVGAIANELYWPDRFSPDGLKLLVTLQHFESASAGIYDLTSKELVRIIEREGGLPVFGKARWSADSKSFYVVNTRPGVDVGGMWRVDAATGSYENLIPYIARDLTINFTDEPYLASNSQLYFFYSNYDGNLGPLSRAPQSLMLVRSGPDAVKDRTELRPENFRMLDEALWAPDASLVVVALASSEDAPDSARVEIVYFDGRSNVLLTDSARDMKWGP